MKNYLFLLICGVQAAYACTSFGSVTKNGTIIGKNRDYIYHPQSFIKMMPIEQFSMWYDNNFNHHNNFYAIVSNNDVKMGVNENGLTAIEEDPPYPLGANKHRMFKQPINGNSEGMILFGVLQNFNTINEIKPYIQQIFSMAAPNFYQFADSQQILTVEVAYGESDADKKRKFTYKIINKSGDYFTHTNTYLNKQYVGLNQLNSNKDIIRGTENRLTTITNYVKSAKDLNINTAQEWFLDTTSNISSTQSPDWCLNTSIFRSNLQNMHSVDLAEGTNKVYGTVSSLIVYNTGNPETSQVYVRMLNSITVMPDDNQLIKYKDVTTNISKLFKESAPQFANHEFIRKKPINDTCQ